MKLKIFKKLLTLTLTGTGTITGTGTGTLTGTGTGTGTGTVIFEGSTVNNINNKWRGFERVERGCLGGGLFELTRWIK